MIKNCTYKLCLECSKNAKGQQRMLFCSSNNFLKWNWEKAEKRMKICLSSKGILICIVISHRPVVNISLIEEMFGAKGIVNDYMFSDNVWNLELFHAISVHPASVSCWLHETGRSNFDKMNLAGQKRLVWKVFPSNYRTSEFSDVSYFRFNERQENA